MIEGFLKWAEQISHHAIQISQTTVTSSHQSSFVLLAYLLTYRKSCIFCVAFLFSEFAQLTDFFGSLVYDELLALHQSRIPLPETESAITFNGVYGLVFYMASMFCWLFFAGIAINQTRNKSLLFWCGTMITFLMAMAADSFINANVETYIWRNYENIILCIHVCIILSLYKPRTIINGLVGKLRMFIDIVRNNYAYAYFWYTVQKRFDKSRLL